MNHHTTHFQTRKLNCLSKRDKSSAGRIDPKAVDICAEINARDEYYTTSSCAGRCFLYCGDGIKSWHNSNNGDVGNNNNESGKKLGFFQRYRVNHDLVNEPQRYFNLTTLIGGQDLTGGGDPIPTIGQFEGHQNNANFKEKLEESDSTLSFKTPIWLRYEPFILHVMCRSLKAASVLMALARPSFKNVGLTSWNSDSKGNDDEDEVNTTVNNQQCKGGGSRYLVAIWGDEGVDMPLSLPTSPGVGLYYDPKNEASTACNADWLAQLVNERHQRNWIKIERFVEEVRSLDEGPVDVVVENTIDGVVHGINRVDLDVNISNGSQSRSATGLPIPRSYDVVGDVAILNSLPDGDDDTQRKVAEYIMSKNKAMKICVARTRSLSTSNCSPGDGGLVQLAGPPRNPIITSHYEYGVKSVIDLQNTFFSPRMAPERLRLSQQVARGERVLVVFAGVGMEALQIVCRTEAKEVVTIEKNEIATECLRRSKRMLERNKTVTCPGGGKGAEERLTIMEGDALEILPTLERSSFDRILAPRPKEGGTLDGDIGTGDSGKEFLLAMLPLLKLKGECHWYDFAADHKLPICQRTRDSIHTACQSLGLEMEVIHVARVGSVAKRQFRVCVDFRITKV